MPYINNYQYYKNNGAIPEDENWGSYQYVSLSDIVNNFILMYVGNDKLVNNVDRYTILFHAKRSIQELNYDALRNIKVLELQLGTELKMIMPPDYVSYVRMSMLINGVLIPLVENRTVMSATAYLQDNNLDIVFDSNGEIVTGTSKLDILRGDNMLYTGGGIYNNQMGYCCDGQWYFNYSIGSRYGMNTEDANMNPKFTINKESGVIDFSSGVENAFIVLEYISDGMENGDSTKITINKLAEEYVYNYLKWAVLNNKYGVQEYIVARAKKEKSATLRNTKIRLSNMHPSRLLMSLAGQDKWIK
jgi:hypothetical protein|tara:strand:- start:1264 stop:2172 length:909 start_codon:yes stop_codon:yes gene_type:complete